MIERQNPGALSTSPANAQTASARRRGRPKGTGINDAEALVRIDALLSADATMKPTTAIKQIGISDPSIIRRLRDKLRHNGGSVSVPLATARAPTRVAKAAEPAQPTRPRQPLPTQPPLVRPPVPQPEVAQFTQPASTQSAATELASSSAPTTQTTQQVPDAKDRETALLAAYLQAMMRSTQHVQPATVQPAPKPAPAAAEAAPNPHVNQPTPQPPAQPFGGFTMPGMPSFLQPFQHRPSTPATPGTPTTHQMEALKLAVEATTAIAKLQLHITENAMTFSPMAMMLQGQSFMGQMMIASLTGQLGSLQRNLMPKKD